MENTNWEFWIALGVGIISGYAASLLQQIGLLKIIKALAIGLAFSLALFFGALAILEPRSSLQLTLMIMALIIFPIIAIINAHEAWVEYRDAELERRRQQSETWKLATELKSEIADIRELLTKPGN